MFKKMPVCRLMISCPSDIRTEIELINKVVENINDSIGISMDVFVKTLHWSKNVMPQAGDYPQSLINKQILDKSDAIIAIFGNKIGSPTQHFESGTIEEIEQMIQKGKQVFVYFSDKPVRKSEMDIEAERKIQAFKEKYQDRGIYAVYESDEDFYESISRNLTRYLTTELVNEANSISESTRFDKYILAKQEFDLIMDYTKFYDIKSVVSYRDDSVLKISVYKECFDMKLDVSNIEETEKQEFAMALFEYVPCDNWSGFFEAGYSLEFDVVACGDIEAFQLEIKDDIRNKIIDKLIEVGEREKHYQILFPSQTRNADAWQKVSQICFTVFLNDKYLKGKRGNLCVKNLKLRPKQ